MNWVETCNLSYALMCAQERAGVRFDIEKARDTWSTFSRLLTELEEEIEPSLPQRALGKTALKAATPPRTQFLKNMQPNHHIKKRFENIRQRVDEKWEVQYPDGSWETLPTQRPLATHEPMKLAHGTDIKRWLQEQHGWIPTFWNIRDGKKTTPKLHENGKLCPNLDAVEWPYLEEFKRYNSLKHRKNLIHGPKTKTKPKETGIVAHVRNGRVPAGSSGWTPTHREKHTIVANLPSVDAYYGKEIRELFIATEGNVFVGYDASSLEARCKGHLTYQYDGGEYARKILDDAYDEHVENAKIWFDWHLAQTEKEKKTLRTKAKPGTYALPYGCSAKKLGKILKCSEAEAKVRYDAYWQLNAPVKQRADALVQEKNTNGGYILGLDKRPLHVREDYKIFNTDCQSAGSVIMQVAGVLMAQRADKIDMDTGTYWFKGLPAQRVLFYHDEYLWDCHPDIADYVLTEGVASIIEAGRQLKLSVALDADGKIGGNYAEVH